MTGIRERHDSQTNETNFLRPTIDTGLLEFESNQSSDPNDSYELREMVVAAAAYLNQGMLDDADELLKEVVDSGYSRPDAVELQLRILEARGGSIEPMPDPEVSPAEDPSPPPIAFTIPLPGVERQPINVQRLIRESDADLKAGRLNSALDAALYVIGSAPGYHPMYVRLAEIQLALGEAEAAATLTATLRECFRSSGSSLDWLLYPIRLAIHPDEVGTLVEYARRLLEQPGLAPMEPFVPRAIVETMSTDPLAAQELSRDYFKAMPLSDNALRLYIRAAVIGGDREAVVGTITSNVRPDSAPDLLLLRSAIGATRGRQEWVEWLERAVVAQQRHPIATEEIDAAIQLLQKMIQPARAYLTGATMWLACGRLQSALDAADSWRRVTTGRSADRGDAFIAACVEAEAMSVLKPAGAWEAFLTAASCALEGDTRSFAESCRLFGTASGPGALLGRMVDAARVSERHDDAIARLRELRDASPDSLEVREALATLSLERGNVADAVRELRFVAERRDAVGDIHGMVSAMRRISDAMPSNPEMKSKIVEGYLQRGVLDEAMRELELLGAIQAERGRREDAVSTYTRGAEVAAAIGNFKRASEFLDAAVLVEPDSDAVRHAAVAFFLRIGAVDRAVSQLWEVVRIAMEAMDPDEAVAALHQIIALTPQDPAAYHKLGEVLASLGEYAQAEKVYRRLALLTPEDPVLAAKQAALTALSAVR